MSYGNQDYHQNQSEVSPKLDTQLGILPKLDSQLGVSPKSDSQFPDIGKLGIQLGPIGTNQEYHQNWDS